MIVIFLAIVVVVPVLIHFYLWKRLVRDVTRPGRWRRVGTAVVGGLVVLLLGVLFAARLLPPGLVRWVAWPAYLWLGLMFYLLVILLVLEVPRLVLRLTWARRPRAVVAAHSEAAVAAAEDSEARASAGAASSGLRSEATREDGAEKAPAPRERSERQHYGASASIIDRRLLLARTLAVAAGVTAVATVGYGVTEALSAPRIDRVRLPLAKLPRRLDGLRIALVTDIHVGPLLGRSHTERVVDLINGVNPDVIAVVGDLVDGSVAELGRDVAPLRRLRARHGSFFVTGNHEYYSGYAEWIDEIGDLGLRVLQNERVDIEGLNLAGVNDVTGGDYQHGPDFERALDGRDPAAPVVMLAHQPVQVHEAAKHDVDLLLAGHTHGGQFQPFGLVVRSQQPVLSGLATIDGTKVYVTNGAGFWGPPVRVGAPPQISVIELRSP